MLPPSDFELMLELVDTLLVRDLPGGKNLTPTMTLWIGRVAFGGYLLFPSQRERDCITPFVNSDHARS